MDKCPTCDAPRTKIQRIGQWADDYCDKILIIRSYVCIKCGTGYDTTQIYVAAENEKIEKRS